MVFDQDRPGPKAESTDLSSGAKGNRTPVLTSLYLRSTGVVLDWIPSHDPEDGVRPSC